MNEPDGNRKQWDHRALSSIRGNPNLSGTINEYEIEEMKILEVLKFRINELCFEFFPSYATMEEMDRLTADIHENIIMLWDRHRPEDKRQSTTNELHLRQHEEVKEAKQLLLDKGYGMSGMSLLRVIKEEVISLLPDNS